MLEILEPILDDVVVTRTTSPRAMDPEQLGSVAVQIFGADRVHVAASLPDALDRPRSPWRRADGIGGGVLVTGSVTTAADARLLLGADDT